MEPLACFPSIKWHTPIEGTATPMKHGTLRAQWCSTKLVIIIIMAEPAQAALVGVEPISVSVISFKVCTYAD